MPFGLKFSKKEVKSDVPDYMRAGRNLHAMAREAWSGSGPWLQRGGWLGFGHLRPCPELPAPGTCRSWKILWPRCTYNLLYQTQPVESMKLETPAPAPCERRNQPVGPISSLTQLQSISQSLASPDFWTDSCDALLRAGLPTLSTINTVGHLDMEGLSKGWQTAALTTTT